ncbi:MAG: hypothetical protein WA655_18335 [Candidatus Korobacteraceae bacterium]
MKAQVVLGRAISFGKFLVSMLLSREANPDQGSRPASGDATAQSGAVVGSPAQGFEANSRQPSTANLGLTLRMMFPRRSRRNRKRWQGPSLPPGCVMLVRYSSR